jgi:hypothetical protein
MMGEPRPNQTIRVSHWSTTRLNTTPNLVIPEDSTVICSCDAEVAETARFCPYCGTPLFSDSSLLPTMPMNAPTTRNLSPRIGSQEENRPPSSKVTTLKEADWIPPLPSKYKTPLKLGTDPELVIWDMFKRLIELRNMLEESVTSLPTELRNTQIQRAESFLRTHCAACGDQIDPKDEGNTPICDQCQSM